MPKTIGEQLKQAREERRLSIEKVVEATRVRARYIEAIEADDFDSLPSPVQTRAFLRLYAEYLGLSLDDLITEQRQLAGAVAPASLPVLKEEAAPPQESKSTDQAEPAAGKEPAQSPISRAKLLAGRAKQLLPKKKAAEAAPESASEKTAEVKEPSATEASVEALPEEKKEDVLPESSTPEVKDTGEARKIFVEIGQALRQRRETLSLTFDEVERHTHVRMHYLQALENGDFDRLPSSVQARGMLNNYASFLDMDSETLLLQFAEGLQSRRVERQPAPIEPSGKIPPKPASRVKLPPFLTRFLSMDILAGGGMVLVLLAFAIWGTTRVIRARNAVTPQPTAPSISDILQNTPAGAEETATPTIPGDIGALPPELEATALITLPPSGPGAVHVVLIAVESAWVRVTVDLKVAFEGRITTGTAYSFDGNNQIEVLTGNGAAVDILYNQSNLGAMGTWGEVVDHIYTANSILNPTPTFTPSPTITPIPSKTPKPSATPRPSFTPRFSPTPTD